MGWRSFLLVLSTSIPSYAANLVANSYDASRGARTYADRFPRFFGDDRFYDVDGGFDPSDNWARNVAFYAAAGLLFSLIALVVFVIVLVLKCVCCRCCRCCFKGKSPDASTRTGQRKCSWFDVITVVVCVYVIGGVATNVALTSSVSTSATGVYHDFYNDVMTRLTNLTTTMQTLDTVTFDATINNVSVVSNQTLDTFRLGLDVFDARVTVSIVTIQQFNGTTVCAKCSNRTYTCPTCAVLSLGMNETLLALRAATNASFREAERTINETIANVVQDATDVRQSIRDALSTVEDVIEFANKTNEQEERYESDIKLYNQLREWFVSILFGMVGVSMIVASVTAKTKFAALADAAWWVLWVPIIVFWIFFAIHMPLSIVVADGCVYGQNYETEELSTPVPERTETVQRVAIGCVEGRNLVETLNLTDTIASLQNFSLPAAPNWTDLLTPPELTAIQTAVAALNTSAVSNVTFSAAVLQFNGLLCGTSPCCPQCVNESNAEDFDVFGYPSNIQTAHTEVVFLKYDLPILDARLTSLRENTSTALNISDLQEQVQEAQDRLDSMGYILDPYKSAVNVVVAQAECNFAVVYFVRLKEIGCTGIVNELAMLSFASFVIGVLGPMWLFLFPCAMKRMT